jgi:hypothetical protein
VIAAHRVHGDNRPSGLARRCFACSRRGVAGAQPATATVSARAASPGRRNVLITAVRMP